jgi:glycosidase
MPFKDWLNYPDSKLQTTHVRTVNQDPNASEYDKNLMTRGWFVETMPDLNGANPYMSTYLIQNTIWWIETLQLGGIRLDTYGYSLKKLLDDWTCRIMKEYPNFNIVGEEWSLNPLVTSYWQAGKRNHDGYTGCLGSTMDFPLQSALVEALRQKDRTIWGKGLNILYESLANDFIYANPNQLLVFGDNHDMDRIYTQLGNDVALTKMAMTCLMTVRGIPQVYYGTEVLLGNSKHLGDHGYIRADMPGGWNGDDVNAFEAKSLNEDQVNMQAYMKKLLNWRKGSKAVTSGKTLHFAPFNDVYVYFRYAEGEKIMVIMNRNEKMATVDPKRFAEIIKTNTKGIDVFSSSTIDITNLFEVPPKSTLVLEIK